MSAAARRRGVGLVLAAPSGAGKSSIARALVARDPDVTLSVSITTRAPRPGEQEGVHYHFRTRAQFDELLREDALLEWAEVFGRRYGTPRDPVDRALAHGRDVVFDIDWQGHRHLRAALPGDVVSVFILPPSLTELEVRLRARGDDPDAIIRRMALAREEMSHCREFDRLVVNADLNEAIAWTHAVLRSARLATPRQVWLDRFLSDAGIP